MATKFHRPVARAASLAAALALTIPLAPLAASAAKSPVALAVHGTVVDTNPARHTLVISTGSAMDTVRFSNPRIVSTVALGTVVTVRASRLADGTFRALSLRAQGHANHTTIHGTVVSDTAKTMVLSAGASTFAVNHGGAVSTKANTGRKSHDSSSLPSVGTEVSVGVTIGQSGLDETSATDLGQSGFIGLEGTLASVSTGTGGVGGTLAINVEDGATTMVTIPTSIMIPSTIKAGDTVELLTSYSGGAFTLVTIVDDSLAATQTTNGVSTDQSNAGYLEAEGLVAAYAPATTTTAGTLTVQPGDGAAALTITVPYNTLVSGILQVGSRVHVTATESSASGTTTLTAVSVRVQQPEGEGNGAMTTQTEGIVIGLPSTATPPTNALVIQTGDGPSVSYTVPSTMDISSITMGARVHVTGTFINGVLTLSNFRVQQPEGDQGNQNNQGQSGSVHLDGTISSYSAGTLNLVQSDGAGSITITVPSDLQSMVAGFATSTTTSVTVTATMVNGSLTLTSIALND